MRYSALFLFLLLGQFSFTQIEDYDFQREIYSVENTWHKIELPQEVLANMNPSLSDIRIFGINKDTTEIPYMFLESYNLQLKRKISAEILNESRLNGNYYFTIKSNQNAPIHQFDLQLENENYDWLVSIEGSYDQKEWFQLEENQRILDITNSEVQFTFSSIHFPKSDYPVYRLQFQSDEKPLLTQIVVGSEKVEQDHRVALGNMQLKASNNNSVTKVLAELNQQFRVYEIQVETDETFDFYRPIKIFAIDSFETQDGRYARSQLLHSGVLRSDSENRFRWTPKNLTQLNIQVYNADNEPIEIKSVTAFGLRQELVARFLKKKGQFFLTYGYKKAKKPQYDLVHFQDKIPDELTLANLGEEHLVAAVNTSTNNSLLKQKVILWGILLFIILLLGWFSFRMLQKVG